MPMMELMFYLGMSYNGILWVQNGTLMTRHGHKYIESKEGFDIDGTPKTIWCRV